MHEELVDSLVHSKNEAADDLLLEGLRVGVEVEQSVILAALFQRKSVRGLSGVVERFESLPERLQSYILSNIKLLHHALRECGRSDRPEMRQTAMRLIALSRQCKLAYVLSENLHESDESLSKNAADAIVALARWVATSTRLLQREYKPAPEHPMDVPAPDQADSQPAEAPIDFPALYRDVMEQRPEIESVVARALDVHRGRHSQELLRAALFLCDWPQSKTLAILQSTKHGGQSTMVRRLQQAPEAEHIEAFLLGAAYGQLRSHFGNIFAHIEEAPVLDALLRKTHWLKDYNLQLCMHQVTRGVWWQEGEMLRDIARRVPGDSCKIGDWLAVSGMHDLMQDERLLSLADRAAGDVSGRLRLLRIAMQRKKPSSVQFLRFLLGDADERLMRMAAREIVRRRPPDFENMLLQLMTTAPASVRRVVSRAIGHSGFEQYWERFDTLDRPTRKQAGRAMIKLLPDAPQRLARRLASGPIEQRLKALQMTQELGLAETLRDAVVALASHAHPKVRSKAISVLGEMPTSAVELLVERIVTDTDSRVRANAIEVLENRRDPQLIPLLFERAKTATNRERANAIKALNKMRVGNVGPALQAMLQDTRPEHRISALWALKQMGWWRLLQEVGRIAKQDNNIRVRRYAVGILKNVAEMVQASKGAA
ncbi:MAG TPA: HEAT repeat domain-containing protein [Tepidisphaeraceae bacterium]|jgi:HEAT repeat protein|nr:HEAT repeat domain-containing protein [Tepidisphaeraceae bacterium]